MGLIILFFIWYKVWGERNPKIYRAVTPNLSKIIPIIFVISILFSTTMPTLIGSFIVLFVLATLFGIPALIIWGILKCFGIGKKREQKNDFAYYQKYYQAPEPVKSVSTTITGLTKSVPKRRKIVEKFNKKHSLNLTDEEIERIVDASYMSNCWECEIYEMDLDYQSIAQWYRSDTSWLRAYLHAFPVQSVSSDFEMQHKIVLESFDTIFGQIHPEKFASVDDCVKAINDTYFTAFDETTFMIAYRFLQANNIVYPMPHIDLVRTDTVLEQLKAKYDREAETDSEKTRQKI